VTGNNTSWPKVNYVASNSPVSVGDRVVTSGHGGVFPPGLAIGTISEASETQISLQPTVAVARLSEARILDYGVEGILPPPEQVPAIGQATPATRVGPSR
jgi:rod shape-determining protein MreC